MCAFKIQYTIQYIYNTIQLRKFLLEQMWTDEPSVVFELQLLVYNKQPSYNVLEIKYKIEIIRILNIEVF